MLKSENIFDGQIWTGRRDAEDGERARRWHQMVRVAKPGEHRPPSIALLGFACDAGVVRNQGRSGAALGPQALRKALANMGWHHADMVAWDFGDIACEDGHLEAAQESLAETVAAVLEEGHRTVVLGGGHEIAYGTFSGLHRWARKTHPSARLGIINLDAHFDLRRPGANGPSSGTPFLQIHDDLESRGEPFRYCCLGIARPSNTAALFDRANDLGVSWRLDEDCTVRHLDATLATLDRFLDGCDLVHLTIDLDALPHAVMPGVSAPAARGIPLEVVEAVVDRVRTARGILGPKLAIADLAELNPAQDSSGISARVAAMLCDRLVRPRRAPPTKTT